MYENTKISNTGYWESNGKLFHVRCEPLCAWIANFLQNDKDKLLYDFGCGNGQYLSKLKELGFTKLIGFDGKVPAYKEFEDIRSQDLAKSFLLPEKGNCIFLEVAEHVPAQYEDILLTNITNSCSDKLIMSWAVRGQGGFGHVNCLNNNEAIAKIIAKGFTYLSDETISARNAIPDTDPYPWFKTTTLVFKKSK